MMVVRALFLLPAFLVLAAPARADVVDGNWCSGDGRSINIDGTLVTIPSGVHVRGEYSRHVFRYVGPADGPESGHDIRMFLNGDNILRIRRFIDGVEQPEEEWRRCKPIV
ncbi:hypothetical protein [Oricola sp.]|uniref:hypothetical protein n=2 Tax=Oricola sp. TaxID=1979950 RepID=UPI0035594FC6